MLDRTIKLYRMSFAACLPLALSGALLAAVCGHYASVRTETLAGQYRSILDSIANSFGSDLPSIGDLSAPIRALRASIKMTMRPWLHSGAGADRLP